MWNLIRFVPYKYTFDLTYTLILMDMLTVYTAVELNVVLKCMMEIRNIAHR